MGQDRTGPGLPARRWLAVLLVGRRGARRRIHGRPCRLVGGSRARALRCDGVGHLVVGAPHRTTALADIVVTYLGCDAVNVTDEYGNPIGIAPQPDGVGDYVRGCRGARTADRLPTIASRTSASLGIVGGDR